MESKLKYYSNTLLHAFESVETALIETFANGIQAAWDADQQILLCGNGGSAANAAHLENDLMYGLSPTGKGVMARALVANESVMSCLGNDLGYDSIFAKQVEVYGRPGDVLIVFSGSGNSPNVLQAIHSAKQVGMTTMGVLGFEGGKAKSLLDVAIHFPVMDMQISEDLQMIVGHAVVQFLKERNDG